jgi:hypothetical protein
MSFFDCGIAPQSQPLPTAHRDISSSSRLKEHEASNPDLAKRTRAKVTIAISLVALGAIGAVVGSVLAAVCPPLFILGLSLAIGGVAMAAIGTGWLIHIPCGGPKENSNATPPPDATKFQNPDISSPSPAGAHAATPMEKAEASAKVDSPQYLLAVEYWNGMVAKYECLRSWRTSANPTGGEWKTLLGHLGKLEYPELLRFLSLPTHDGDFVGDALCYRANGVFMDFLALPNRFTGEQLVGILRQDAYAPPQSRSVCSRLLQFTAPCGAYEGAMNFMRILKSDALNGAQLREILAIEEIDPPGSTIENTLRRSRLKDSDGKEGSVSADLDALLAKKPVD